MVISTEDTGPDDLIMAADCALYKAKEEGKNRVEIADPLCEID